VLHCCRLLVSEPKSMVVQVAKKKQSMEIDEIYFYLSAHEFSLYLNFGKLWNVKSQAK
jgi:hypothetical protein